MKVFNLRLRPCFEETDIQAIKDELSNIEIYNDLAKFQSKEELELILLKDFERINLDFQYFKSKFENVYLLTIYKFRNDKYINPERIKREIVFTLEDIFINNYGGAPFTLRSLEGMKENSKFRGALMDAGNKYLYPFELIDKYNSNEYVKIRTIGKGRLHLFKEFLKKYEKAA